MSDITGDKKRRRRGKTSKAVVPETQPVVATAEDDFKIQRANKKVKFGEESLANEVETVRPVKEVQAVIPAKEAEASVVIPETSPSVSEVPTKTQKKPKATKAAKKVVYFDSDDEEKSFTKSKSISSVQLGETAQILLETRKQLPIYQHKDTIIQYIQNNQVTVIIGETGSGKSTQIPQFLMPSNKKQIAVTQPRRVAAASLAARVSEEFGCVLGEEIGYQVRFANITLQRTQLKYLTDGMLLREIMLDSKLMKYSTIILDEAHERTVLTDLIMGFLKQLIITKQRTDLKVIIMSATLNAELFSGFFNNCPILFIEGKMFPVQQYYLSDNSEDLVDTMIRSIIQINRSEQEGDILCFLPGQEEIDNCVTALTTIAPQLPKDSPMIVPIPLYAALSPGNQAKIFEKLGARKRKIILATNIAETSITVSGVKYVIDSGLRKVKVWKHQLGLSTLLTTPISQASAKQRAGRAGRESEGKVFRLYLEKTFNSKLPKQQESEILRNDIILPILTLKKIGVEDLLNWTWLEHPGQESILSALNLLYALGALDDAGKITSLGFKMSVLPLPPQLSAVLITAMGFGVLSDVIDVVSCLAVDNLILNIGSSNGELRDEINYKRRQYCPLGCHSGDLIALKEYFDYFQEASQNSSEAKSWCKELHFNYKGFKNVLKVRHQLREYMVSTIKQDDSMKSHQKDQLLKDVRAQFEGDDEDLKKPLDIPLILKSFLKGYITNTAVGMPDRLYRTFNTGQLVSIHPSSNLFGKVNLDAIMYIEYVYTTKGYGRTCSVIELEWLQEVAPHILGASKINVNE